MIGFVEVVCRFYFLFFFFKQKTAYEMRISDWSSDVCSSDLGRLLAEVGHPVAGVHDRSAHTGRCRFLLTRRLLLGCAAAGHGLEAAEVEAGAEAPALSRQHHGAHRRVGLEGRSEEHTSELQSLMRISYAVFCLKKKKKTDKKHNRKR